jgi:signal transduction histidine kinase
LYRRSIGQPLTIGIILMILLIALAVGWQVMVWTDLRVMASGLDTLAWVLLVLGTLCFLLIMAGLAWLCVWLVNEMRLNQRQRAFMDAVTHEMKTPLASFRLYLDTLGRHDPPLEQRREFIGRMQEDLDRLDRTVRQVLAAARAEERTLNPSTERVQLGQLLAGCVRDVCERHRLSDDAVQFSAINGAVVDGNPAELQLIFSNLLDNAVKYSNQPVDVQVDVKAMHDGRVKVEIADSGIGIPPRELRKIFQRFYRVGRDVQRTVAGLGLGLFVVRSLVRRQGGSVVAQSGGDGLGSRFVVTLRSESAGSRWS